MSVITVDPNTFRMLFPYFSEKGTTDEQIEAAYDGVPSIVPTTEGALSLPVSVQTRGVYLATAHLLYLSYNPSKASSGNLSSASEGSVSASFALYSDPWRRWLSTTPFGVELLAILSQVQPPMPSRPVSPYPYYQGGFYGKRF